MNQSMLCTVLAAWRFVVYQGRSKAKQTADRWNDDRVCEKCEQIGETDGIRLDLVKKTNTSLKWQFCLF